MKNYLRYFVIVVAVLFVPRIFVYAYASYLKTDLTTHIRGDRTDQETVEKFAKWAADYWRISREADFWNRLRRLPHPFKANKNAISFLSGDGSCSEFVRAARWVLGDEFRVARHDVMFPHKGHSAVSVKLSDGRWVFIDPFFGWIFKDKERLLSLEELSQRMHAGQPVSKFAVSLKPESRTGLYDQLLNSFHAKESERMEVRLRLPVHGKDRWSLGELDGKWDDVEAAGKKNNLTSHFFYVGARFPADFHFTYSLPRDGRPYDIYFHLTEEPSAGKLPVFSIAPTIEGKSLHLRVAREQRTLTVDPSNLPVGVWYAIDRFEVIAGSS